ncbi:breast cancer metastasis-suppressor [Anaeramoeba flamelloides]|uniref:Breast cancer metastasis-suppressor n=1 Tax=Anaeramoeba flamelloides TaxID=1746091 RepID=A0AAV7YSH1_9EUKA|nr:breast cancer metastasis-suppressor [Anaeramoeba flamelloides]
MTNNEMDVEQTETITNSEFSTENTGLSQNQMQTQNLQQQLQNQNQTQNQTQNLQQQPQTTQNQTKTNNEAFSSTTILNSTNLHLTQNNEEDFQFLINELKSNNMQIGEQEKKLVKKAHTKFLEEMELLKTDRDERLQEIRNWYDILVTNLKNSFEFEKKQFQDTFEEEKKLLKQKMLLDLKKKDTTYKQMLQNQQKKKSLESKQPPKNVYLEFLQQLNRKIFQLSFIYFFFHSFLMN